MPLLGPILAISMLWFGWTSYPWISLWAPVMAGFGTGVALIMLFLSLFNYIIDAYLAVAASALASSTVVRSAFGAGFPVSHDPRASNVGHQLTDLPSSSETRCMKSLIPVLHRRY